MLVNKGLSIDGAYGTASGTSWSSKVINFGGFSTELGVRLRALIFRLRAR